jgi:hypothetical protein
MRKHNGMRPQDIVILLKIMALDVPDWKMKDIALGLGISPSEVTESLERSSLAGLIAKDKRRVMRDNVLEFLVHGLKYVFPAVFGPSAGGISTAHSAPPLDSLVASNVVYVWQYPDGTKFGPSIIPLIPSVPQAAMRDSKLYELLALVESLRVGQVRERNLAAQILEKKIWNIPIIV